MSMLGALLLFFARATDMAVLSTIKAFDRFGGQENTIVNSRKCAVNVILRGDVVIDEYLDLSSE